MIKVITGNKINIATTSTDYEGNSLSCGDPVLYPCDKGYVIFGWYLGKSVSGKTTYMMTREGHPRQVYHNLIKHYWKEPVYNYNAEHAYKKYESAKESIQKYSEEILGISNN